MDTTYVASLIVGERGVELRRRADRARLAAGAPCCTPA